MKRMGGWLSSKANVPHSRSLTALDEPQALQDALKSAALIMDDEIERAETELSQGTSPFHKLGRATTFFLRATLGFEKEIMEEASKRLAEAEESASEHHRRALRDPGNAYQSKIYPTGSEYALCHAETQLMSAVIGVLNESLTESLRGFYKLRKAFATLHEIVEAENKYLDKHFSSSKSSLATSEAEKKQSGPYGSDTPATSSGVMTPVNGTEEEAEDMDFKDAEEGLSEQPTPMEYQGHLELSVADLALEEKANGEEKKVPLDPPPAYANPNGASTSANEDIDFRNVTSDPVDLFVHSGAALCFGLLQLLLSMIPPAFSRILSIFSFRGDRENGIRLLWEATAFKDNVNGGMAGMITLGFHNAAIGLCDIHRREAFPQARLHALLQDMQRMYPHSVMWVLEEARGHMAARELERAADILQNNPLVSPLKQVQALRVFETSMCLMFLHRYEECAKSFIKCMDLNNWSPGLYLYIAASCYVELYRNHQVSDPKKAEEYKHKASELYSKVTAHTGKKRMLGRQLPLDQFISRKISKWTERSKTLDRDLVDSVGVSPLTEMKFFWSGFKRMRPEHVQNSFKCLAWSEEQPNFKDEPIDERAILALLKATCSRSTGKLEDAKRILEEDVFCYQWHQLKASPHADNWPLPVAHYEKAVCLWQEAGGQDGDREKLRECSDELWKVERHESFDLEARIGLKVTTARETLTRIGIGHP